MIQSPRCELRTFGSVKLDVHTPDADIDFVFVAPRHCTRTAFFDRLAKRLENREDVGEGQGHARQGRVYTCLEIEDVYNRCRSTLRSARL